MMLCRGADAFFFYIICLSELAAKEQDQIRAAALPSGRLYITREFFVRAKVLMTN